MNKINVGIIGFGTVGTGLVKILQQKKSHIKKTTGISLNLAKICDLDIKRDRGVKLDKDILTKNVRDVLEDPRIDIVVELIGGIKPAKEFIIKALENGKHVVTANKALLAQDWEEIFAKAKECKRDVLFEASICGAIPIVKVIRESYSDNAISEIVGIVNGTANFILTKMQEEGMDFKECLQMAQEQGYAEADPTYDIKGIDAAHKIALLSTLCFGNLVQLKDVFVEGIDHISVNDIAYAKELGYTIKLLAIAKKLKNKIEVRVHPTLISHRHPLASVRDVFNAVFLKADLVGDQLLYGRGAGEFPTASAVMSDVLDLSFGLQNEEPQQRYFPAYVNNKTNIQDMNDLESKYYIRIMALDKPGVFSSLAGILGRDMISISTVIQKVHKKGATVPVVLVTHKVKERNIRRALKTINSLPVVKGKCVALRIEQNL